MDERTLSRRGFLGGAALAAGTIGVIGGATLSLGTAQAAAPLAGTPLPGVVRRKVGSFEVTALLDGYLPVGHELIIGYEEATAAALREAAFVPETGMVIPISAYLVNTGEKLILIDAGTSDKMGPTLGKVATALQAAGVTPDQIDAIFITHMHPDHLFGVLTPTGEKLFPNAELVLPETDRAFWYDDANMNAAPESVRPFFVGARAAADAYQSRQTLFSGEAELIKGIRPLALPGHTPGHSGFVLDSDGQTLIIAGDIMHAAAYQFAHPEWGIAFDVDPAAAVATRKRFFDQAASDRVMFAGAHIPFPGFGHVARDGDAYRFVAAEWPYA
ncbi:MBL fold metallo-hydrolase [Roseibium sp.]|uniref:MBL fold metallo-hydrolase n=1 Tax=Roseibium sp. TaxID=1936156 RepID=UPI003A98869B